MCGTFSRGIKGVRYIFQVDLLARSVLVAPAGAAGLFGRLVRRWHAQLDGVHDGDGLFVVGYPLFSQEASAGCSARTLAVASGMAS